MGVLSASCCVPRVFWLRITLQPFCYGYCEHGCHFVFILFISWLWAEIMWVPIFTVTFQWTMWTDIFAMKAAFRWKCRSDQTLIIKCLTSNIKYLCTVLWVDEKELWHQLVGLLFQKSHLLSSFSSLSSFPHCIHLRRTASVSGPNNQI